MLQYLDIHGEGYYAAGYYHQTYRITTGKLEGWYIVCRRRREQKPLYSKPLEMEPIEPLLLPYYLTADELAVKVCELPDLVPEFCSCGRKWDRCGARDDIIEHFDRRMKNRDIVDPL